MRLPRSGIRCRVASLDVTQPGRKTDERGFVLKEVRGQVGLPHSLGGLEQLAESVGWVAARIAIREVLQLL